MEQTEYLILPLLQGFCWFDDGLQACLDAGGWHHITRTQSMVMISILSGNDKPSRIARGLGITRQAAHVTIAQLIKLDIVELCDDPADGRAKVVALTEMGHRMREEANEAVRALTVELRRRIGSRQVDNLFNAFAMDWGDVPTAVAAGASELRQGPPAARRPGRRRRSPTSPRG